MSVMDADLLAESYRLLNQARVVAEASAAQPPDVRASAARPATPGRTSPHSKQHKHAHPESSPPPGIVLADDGTFSFYTSTLEACGRRINAAIEADSDNLLRAANRWATREIEALRHGAKTVDPETPAQWELRIVKDYEGVTAPDVARAELRSVTLVRSARVKHGRTGRFGHKVAGKRMAGV